MTKFKRFLLFQTNWNEDDGCSGELNDVTGTFNSPQEAATFVRSPRYDDSYDGCTYLWDRLLDQSRYADDLHFDPELFAERLDAWHPPQVRLEIINND